MKILSKDINLVTVSKAGPVFTLEGQIGWRQIGTNFFVFETYYDLAGMSQEEKTLFFDAATVQDVTNPAQVNGVAGDLLGITDLMTSSPLSDDALTQFTLFGNMVQSKFPSFDQVIYARNQIFVVDLDFAASGYFNLLSSNQLGSMQPTASDRIYVYRVVAIDTDNTATSYTVLPARFLLQATAKEEPEYQYLTRLMRSYNLQNEPDRD
jgi:hypothetical protein